MKKIILTMMALFMLSATGFTQSGSCGEKLIWTLSDGTLTITGKGEMRDFDYPDNAPWYSYSTEITTVVIGDEVVSIGNHAFSDCNKLTSITIPKNVTGIGVGAFSNCRSLAAINIPQSVTSIGNRAFYGTQWYDNQPDGVIYINNVLYKYKGNMQDGTVVNVRKGTVRINPEAFFDCRGLAEVTVPKSLKSTGYYAFYNSRHLLSVSNSQNTQRIANTQLKWGVKAGLNVSSFGGIKDEPEEREGYSRSSEQKSKAGFHVGVNVQYLFTSQVGIESGLYYSTLGTKNTEKETYITDNRRKYIYNGKSDYAASYLQLPVSLLYKFNLGRNLSLYPSVGLYAGYGIGGEITWKSTEDYLAEKRIIKSGEMDFFGNISDSETEGEKEYTNRFDFGLTTGLTLQYYKFTFGLGYDLGLSPVDKKIEGEYSLSDKGLKNRNVKVSVGYFF